MSRWSQWPEYVPVAERRAKAKRAMNQLRKKGANVQPIEIEGRTIARSYWGKGWCQHLEAFSDYENRLPRGRTYVRNGSVCHLAIESGYVEAKVSGSSMYNIKINIKALSAKDWKGIKQKCTGHIGSMLELLQGKLSKEVMTVVSDPKHGLFPQPHEISFSCSCPDWASMCKHVAATLYGVGHRLDHEPDLLFLLRQVDPQELLETKISIPDADNTAPDELLDLGDLSDIFGIDVEFDDTKATKKTKATKTAKATKATKKTKAAKAAEATAVTKKKIGRPPKAKTSQKSTKKAAKKPTDKPETTTVAGKRIGRPPKTKTSTQKPAKKPVAASDEFCPTGQEIAKLREMFDYTAEEFAEQIGVSTPTIYQWEATEGPVSIQPGPKRKLELLW